MMLSLLLFLSHASADVSQGPAAAPAEITVIGKRLERLRFTARVKKGQVRRCRITRSSGDPAFDAIACPAVRDCAARELRTPAEAESCMMERLRARFDALQAQAQP